MYLSEKISLQHYADSANQKFTASENKLYKIEGSFQTRMNGKTIGRLVRALLGTLCWVLLFGAFFWYIKDYIDRYVYLAGLSISLALMVAMIVDEIISISYYGKISSYIGKIIQFKNGVIVARSSIKSSQDELMKYRTTGWLHPLSVSPSILEEADSLENTINSMESFKGGFLNGLKNFLFFCFAIVITVVGSSALFLIAEDIVMRIAGEYVSGGVLIGIISLVIAVAADVFFAKKAWSKADCSVTNNTLFVAALGPVMFMALATIAALLVVVVLWGIAIVIAGGIIALVVAVLSASAGG